MAAGRALVAADRAGQGVRALADEAGVRARPDRRLDRTAAPGHQRQALRLRVRPPVLRRSAVADQFNACTYLVDRQVAAGHGAATAIRCGERNYSYAELSGAAAAVAQALTASGVRPEERVMLLMVDGVELLTGILGAMRMGAVAVPISTMLTAGELATLLRDSRARVLLVSAQFGPLVTEAVPQAPDLAGV